MHKMLLQAGACAVGCVSRRRLEGLMDADAQARAEALCPQWKSLLCAAFPYGGAAGDSRISLYARGADYHAVLRTRLEQAAEGLQAAMPHNRFVFCADVSPFPEVRAAALAGLGKLGRQGSIFQRFIGNPKIHPFYGIRPGRYRQQQCKTEYKQKKPLHTFTSLVRIWSGFSFYHWKLFQIPDNILCHPVDICHGIEGGNFPLVEAGMGHTP